MATTTDRREALDGADFVVNTALVAGYDRLRDGWEIAVQHGYRFGGSLHVMHDEPFWINVYQLRFFDEVVRDVLELCPDAWYLQVANPVLAGMTWLCRATRKSKMVGLCHGFGGVYKIADTLGLDRDKLTFENPGGQPHRLPHPRLAQWPGRFPADRRVDRERGAVLLGDMPAERLPRPGGGRPLPPLRRLSIGDTCNPGGGSWPWWYHTDAETERRWHEDPAAWWARSLHPRRGAGRGDQASRRSMTRDR